MCTLTVFKHCGRLIITMNRDERRERTESGTLQHYQVGSGAIAYPVDDRSGGTWLGVNSHGLCLCLTNRYRGVMAAHSTRPSRGSIIPRLLEAGDFAAVHDAVPREDFDPYPDFDLFLFSRSDSRHFCWDRGQLKEAGQDVMPPFLHVSSARCQEKTRAYRQDCFQAFCEQYAWPHEIPADAVINDFHQHQAAGSPQHSVLMDREDARTQSSTQVILGHESLRLDYRPRAADGFFLSARRLVLETDDAAHWPHSDHQRGEPYE